MSERTKENIGIAIVMVVMLVFLLIAAQTEKGGYQPVNPSREEVSQHG